MTNTRIYIRTNAVEEQYELMLHGQKVYDFESASQLHEFVLQAMSTLRWSIRDDFGKLKELSGK